jgi:phosphoribosylaminoimidazole-succinocarboxamide synthase
MLESDLPGIEKIHKGKVRDLYAVGDDLLIVATDRISAFDCVFPTPVPEKGRILTSVSNCWFRMMKFVDNHLIETDAARFPDVLAPHRAVLDGRSVLVKRAARIDFECVVRGYLAGSGFKEYVRHGTVCGETLPTGLREGERLPWPIFTPATKADTGHDQNVPFSEMVRVLGKDLAEDLRRKSLQLYDKAHELLMKHGIIIADTKFEFGLLGDRVILIDELLTPDSSRFWPADRYAPGSTPPGLDKQYVRDYVEGLDWNKQPPAPALPAEVVEKTLQKYLEIERIVVKAIG